MKYFNNKRFSMKQVVFLLSLVIVGIAIFAYASTVTIPNTFTSGTTISSSEMNANFTAVKTAVDDNDARLGTLESVRTGYVSVAALNGVSLSPSYVTGLSQEPTATGPQGRYAVSAGNTFIDIPVTLPHGATIESFTYVAYDNDPSLDTAAWLMGVGDSTNITLAFAITTGSLSTDLQFVTGASSEVIDNTAYAYHVRMRLDGGASGNNLELVAMKAIIQYTYSY